MATKPNLKLYDSTKTYMAPSGALMTPEKVARQWPAAQQNFPFVVETDAAERMMLSMDALATLASVHNVDVSGMADADAVEEIADAIYQERVAAEGDPTESSAEERTAAALEAIVMNNMATVNDDDPDAE